MPKQLVDLPEELLERILAYTLALTSSVWNSTAPPVQPHLLNVAHSSSTPLSSSLSASTSTARQPLTLVPSNNLPLPVPAYAPLLTCTRLLRIGGPLLYTDLHLTTRAQMQLVLRTFDSRPDYAACVRRLRVEGIWSCVAELVHFLTSLHRRADVALKSRLEEFDFCMDFHPSHDAAKEAQADAFLNALEELPTLGTVRRLTIRRTPQSYLNLPGPMRMVERLGVIIETWVGLEVIDVAFRLPSGPITATHLTNALAQLHPTQPHPAAQPVNIAPAGATVGFIAAASARFISALARTPSLKVIRTQLPAVWNTAFLEISTNPSLQAIVLTPCPSQAGANLFLTTARKYARLFALIQAGMSSPLPAAASRARHGPPVCASAYSHAQEGTSGRARANSTVITNSGVPFPPAASGPRKTSKLTTARDEGQASSSSSRLSGCVKRPETARSDTSRKDASESSSASTSKPATSQTNVGTSLSASRPTTGRSQATTKCAHAQSEAAARKLARAARRISVA